MQKHTESITQFFENRNLYSCQNRFEILWRKSRKITGFATSFHRYSEYYSEYDWSTLWVCFHLGLCLPKEDYSEEFTSISPLKRMTKNLEKIQKNGDCQCSRIPVVALGQAIICGNRLLIFGAPSPLLFILTFIGSMIPIVGSCYHLCSSWFIYACKWWHFWWIRHFGLWIFSSRIGR